MSKHKYTPGPWSHKGHSIYSASGRLVAMGMVQDFGEDWAQVTNNTKLAAAAPQLLEALKWAVSELAEINKKIQDVSIDEQLPFAEAAIKKATE